MKWKEEDVGNFNNLIKKWIDEAVERFEGQDDDPRNIEERVREYYEPDLYYHLTDSEGITFCNINTNSNSYRGNIGKWTTQSSLQAVRKPCPECIKKSMQESDKDDRNVEGNPWR